MPNIDQINKACQDNLASIIALFLAGIVAFVFWGYGFIERVSAMETEIKNTEHRLRGIEAKLVTVGEDVAVSKAILQRLENRQ